MIQQNILYLLSFYLILKLFNKKKITEKYTDPEFNEKLQPLEIRQIRELDKFFVMERYEMDWILIERLFTESDRENNKAYKYLINSINKLSKFGITLLTLAAQHGEYKIVKYLLANGAIPNKLNMNRIIALHKAANKPIILMLKESGSDPNYRDTFGNTPLITNSYRGEYEAIKGLIEVGASINLSNNNGVTALMNSTHYDTNVTKLLLDNNALVHYKDKNGNTALHYAAKYGSMNAIKDLIEAGSKMNVKNNDGNTPLLLAKDEYILLFFIKNRKKWKIDIDIKNNNRKSIKNAISFKNYKNLKNSLNIQKYIIIGIFTIFIVFSIIFMINKKFEYGNVDYDAFHKDEIDDLLDLDIKKLDFLNKDKI